MSPEVEANFSSVFPCLAEATPERVRKFAKVQKVLSAYAEQLGRESVGQLGMLDLAGEDRNPREGLTEFVEGFYDNESTGSTQSCNVTRLIEEEFEAMARAEPQPPEAAVFGLLDSEKLQPHMKEIWLRLPRRGGRAASITGAPDLRGKLPLAHNAGPLFKALLKVNAENGVTDVRTLLLEHNYENLYELKSSVHHRDVRRAVEMLGRVRARFGLNIREHRRLAVEKLPPKLRLQLKTFRERARLGVKACPELKRLAAEYKYEHLEPLSPGVIDQLEDSVLMIASKIKLEEGEGIEDLLALRPRAPRADGEASDGEYFSPKVEPYRKSEEAKLKPGLKRAGYDTVMFRKVVAALCAVARFNGEFLLASRFRRHYKVKTDSTSANDRRRLKKKRLTRQWIDEQIVLMKKKFDTIVSNRSFLESPEDLELCLFLPQLVVLRYLGFRQQCLRKCVINKNIIFNRDGSVTFHYGRDEIKNKVLIDQTFSLEAHGEVKEIALVLNVLKTYYRRVLGVFRARYGGLYREVMGEAFFAWAPPDGDAFPLRPYTANQNVDPSGEKARGSNYETNRYTTWFEEAAYSQMDFDNLQDFGESFNPHFLRAVCCDWMKKDLHWDWEMISKAMGDAEVTLKKYYYQEDARTQDAGDPFAETSRKRVEEKERISREAAAVPAETLNSVNSALEVTSRSLKEETGRRATAESERDFLLRYAGLTPDGLKQLMSQEQTAAGL